MIIEKNNHLIGWGAGCSPSQLFTTFSFIFNSILILGIFLLFQHLRQVISCTVSNNRVNYSGRSKGGPPLFLDQKKFRLDHLPPLSQGLDDRPPPPTSNLKDWIHH